MVKLGIPTEEWKRDGEKGGRIKGQSERSDFPIVLGRSEATV